ncbi:MAG TPA: hypothetical protein H9744_06975 [Candidatus Eisenbergiella stercoravium]|nr:hypothetical protein [Candidatus Eisenbergiella stercoravium]
MIIADLKNDCGFHISREYIPIKSILNLAVHVEIGMRDGSIVCHLYMIVPGWKYKKKLGRMADTRLFLSSVLSSFVFVLLSATALVKLRFPQLLPLSRQASCESDLFSI